MLIRNVFACILALMLSPLTLAEYRAIDVVETLEFTSGPKVGEVHPKPDSGLYLNAVGSAPYADIGCIDNLLVEGMTRTESGSFNVVEGTVPVIAFKGEAVRLGEGLSSYYSYVTSRFEDGTAKSGGLFAEFTVERDITYNMTCPTGFQCEKTEFYDVSYADTRSGSEFTATKVIKTALSYDGTCYRVIDDVTGQTEIVQCPIQVSCTEQWDQVGEQVGSPLTTPSTLDMVKDFVNSVFRDDSEGDVQPKTKTSTIGVRG